MSFRLTAHFQHSCLSLRAINFRKVQHHEKYSIKIIQRRCAKYCPGGEVDKGGEVEGLRQTLMKGIEKLLNKHVKH